MMNIVIVYIRKSFLSELTNTLALQIEVAIVIHAANILCASDAFLSIFHLLLDVLANYLLYVIFCCVFELVI